MAPTSRKASCKGCSLPLCSTPSIVVICLPAQSPTWVVQDRVALPSIVTVQAPQRPSPQPYLLPLRSRSSRKTLSRLRAGSTSTRCLLPLTWNSVAVVMSPPLGNGVLMRLPWPQGSQTVLADGRNRAARAGNKPLCGAEDSLHLGWPSPWLPFSRNPRPCPHFFSGIHGGQVGSFSSRCWNIRLQFHSKDQMACV